MEEKSRTTKLWLIYMQYVHLVKMFIFAERTSDWELHLFVLEKMLNLFAATGHSNYAKCARLYLQEMAKLPQTYPWIYEHFLNGEHTIRRTATNWTGVWTDLAIEQTLMRSLKSRGGLTVGRGMSESVRHQWVLSLSSSAYVHNAMVQITGAAYKSSEQHHEMGISRVNQDHKDTQEIKDWLSDRNPFLVPGNDLHALSSGLVSVNGKDDVNCEKAEAIGKAIQTGLNDVNFNNASIKRKDKIKSLESLLDKVSKREEKVTNPTIMFNRIVAIAEREGDLESFFDYELTTEPMSLFKNGMLRKPDKPSLRKIIMPEEIAVQKDTIKNTNSIVLDGGAFLHKVRWAKGKKFLELAEIYHKYITKYYDVSKVVIVFDGYEDESIKSHEHMRRNQIPQSCDVKINAENLVPFTQDRFLSNTGNKAAFVLFLSEKLKDWNVKVINCKGDADSTIVKTALDIARHTPDPVVVVADDTDIAVMLVHHWETTFVDIYFLQERWNKAWSIRDATSRNKDIKPYLLFIHAFSGCDTTSSIYGKGKSQLAAHCSQSEIIQELAEIISSPWSNQIEIGDASVSTFKILYGGNQNDSMKRLRYCKYIDLACKGTIAPEKLPPSRRAAFHHGLRAHYQIIQWSLLDDFDIEATEWGWKLTDNVLVPIKNDMEIAPEILIKVIRCRCKITTKNPCGSKTCTCRKYGMACLSSCAECCGSECNNAAVHPIIEEEEEEEIDDETFYNGNAFDIFADTNNRRRLATRCKGKENSSPNPYSSVTLKDIDTRIK